MANLWNRFKRFIKGSAHDTLDSLENVESTSKQIVREIDEKVQSAQSSLIKAESRMMLVQDDFARAQKDSEKWNADAVRAVAAGKRDLALQCAAKAQEANAQAEMFKSELVTLEDSVDALRKQIDDAYRDRNAVATDVTIMQTQMHVANAAADAAEAIAAVNTNDQLSEIGALRRRVNEKSAEARAKVASNERRSGNDLNKQLRELDSQSNDDYLNNLMRTNASISAAQVATPAIIDTGYASPSSNCYTSSHSDAGSSRSSSSSCDSGGGCSSGGGGDCG
jgi:phage shock protein A